MNTTSQDTNSAEAGQVAIPVDDAALGTFSRDQALRLSADMRRRWFRLRRVKHAELLRVARHLDQLIDPYNDTKIISIIGPTGIGKTTLATGIFTQMANRYEAQRKPHEVPVVYVSAPANGEQSMSWKTLYRRILATAGEEHLDLQRQITLHDGEMRSVRPDRMSLAHLREVLEAVIRYRNIRVIVIDEVMHLLRFQDNLAIMDTLKSLADIHDTKLVLIGTYQIAPLMIEYGQLARRSAILHYRRYAIPQKSNPAKLTEDQSDFKAAVARLQAQWPCVEVPQLESAWEDLMRVSLGSVGLLKSQLLELASLQMTHAGVLQASDLANAIKPPKQLRQIETEILMGEQELAGACYGDAASGSEAAFKQLFAKLTGAAP